MNYHLIDIKMIIIISAFAFIFVPVELHGSCSKNFTWHCFMSGWSTQRRCWICLEREGLHMIIHRTEYNCFVKCNLDLIVAVFDTEGNHHLIHFFASASLYYNYDSQWLKMQKRVCKYCTFKQKPVLFLIKTFCITLKIPIKPKKFTYQFATR